MVQFLDIQDSLCGHWTVLCDGHVSLYPDSVGLEQGVGGRAGGGVYGGVGPTGSPYNVDLLVEQFCRF